MNALSQLLMTLVQNDAVLEHQDVVTCCDLMVSMPKAFHLSVKGIGLRPSFLKIPADLLEYWILLLFLTALLQTFNSGQKVVADSRNVMFPGESLLRISMVGSL